MNTTRSESYTVPMSRTVLMGFFAAAALIAGVAAWCFASGLTWSGICMIAVAAPIGLLFWYMLHVNPSRAVIIVAENGLMLNVPPFVNTEIPYQDITSAERIDMKTDDPLAPGKPVRGMRWGGYRAGTFALKEGGEATVAASSRDMLLLRTGNGTFLVGPREIDAFHSALRNFIS